MATQDVRSTNHSRTPRRRNQRTAHVNVRERLLTALPVTERRLSLNGVTTAVLEGGNGRPMVLLHGPAAYGAAWLRVIPNLVKTHRVIAPDLPAHGASEKFAGPVDIDRVTGWLDDLIECTCSEPPVVVAQTLGGAIAARFAAQRSERLAQLVLVDTLGLTAFQPEPEFGQALNEFLSAPNEGTHDRLWKRCAFDLDALRLRMGEQWESIKAYTLDRATAPGLLAGQGTLMEQFGIPAIPTADLARIAVPTTLIWGRHDLATPLSVGEEASIRFGWPLHVIESAADDPPFEQPEAFLKVLHAVLETSSYQEARQ